MERAQMSNSFMEFSFDDFQIGWRQGCFNPPKCFSPYTGLDPRKLHKYKKEHAKENKGKDRSILDVFDEIEKRVDKEYCKRLMPLAKYSLGYSADVFPVFDLLYAEIIADDWLAMAGWHEFQRDHLIHQPLTAYSILKMLRGWKKANGEIIQPLVVNDLPLIDHCVDAVLFNERCYDLREYFRRMEIRKSHSNQIFGKNLFALKENNKDRYNTPLFQFWRQLFIETAFVAAMFHDIGYPWQYIQRLSEALHQAKTSLVLHHESSNITIKDFENHLLYVVLNGYRIKEVAQPLHWDHIVEKGIEKGFEKTHGLPGAFTFLLLNDIFRDYPKEKTHTWHVRQFVIEWASVAICMHDFSKIFRGDYKSGECPDRPSLRVSFEKDPLSAVLCLADFMQDFERHAACYSNQKIGKDEITTLQFKPTCKKVTLDFTGNTAKIVFYQSDMASAKLKNHYLQKDKEELFSSTGYLDFSSLGINYFDTEARI